MATISNVRTKFAEKMGISVSILERHLRALQEAQIIPTARPGGGVGGYHFTKENLTDVILGFAAGRHIDAPDAVHKLRPLKLRHGVNVPADVAEALRTLEDQVADWIYSFGTDLRNGGKWLPEDLAILRSFKMQLCLDPCHAIVWITNKDGAETQYLFVNDPEAPRPAIQRLTIISGDALLAAAELLVVTERQTNLIDIPLSEIGSAKTPARKKQDAGNLRQEAPAPISDQPRANETGGFHALPEAIREDHGFQGKPRRRQAASSRKKEPTNA